MQSGQLKRREFITLLGGTAAAWPVWARAQQPAMPVVGFLHAAAPQRAAKSLQAFLKGLGEAGYVDGRNVAIEYRWAENRIDQLPALVADLTHHQVAVIAATTTPAALAAKAGTTTIPIVFETAADPVKIGLVTNLNRPTGNLTGVTQTNVETTPKRLEFLHELLPTAHVMALLVNPDDPALAETETSTALAAAHTLGLELHVLNASTERDFDGVFEKLSELRVAGLVVAADVLFTSHIEQLALLTVRHAMPAAYQWREFTVAGGLLSYGADLTDSYRQVGIYAGRILKGDKPADLPVQQATKVELYVNLKTAKTLRLNVPTALLVRADEVIE